MAKKIRFPLILAEGAQVRSIEELREHFDLDLILGYYKSGKLLTWLEDRYLEGEARAIRTLDEAALDFQRRLCEALQVEYTGADVDLEAIRIRQERLAHLRTMTDEDEFLQNIDNVAFDQEELADLLDEEQTTVYLCGKRFTVPASRKGVTYVGINEPEVKISGDIPANFDELGITFRTCKVDRPAPPKPEPLKQEHQKEIPQGAQIVAVSDFPFMDVNGWQDIVSVACNTFGVIGIKRDGSVVGEDYCSGWWWKSILKEWNNMISIAWGVEHVVGLRRDGTVAAKETMSDSIWCMVNDWSEITAVACGNKHTVGLRRDGTVVAVGINNAGQCDVRDWEDIVSIGCTVEATYGLKQDGTVISTGRQYGDHYNTRSWRDIVSIDSSMGRIVGLKRDGTVVTEGCTELLTSNFQDIISVACGNGFIAGLRRDGTVVIASAEFDVFAQKAENWKNVVSIAAGIGVLVGIVGPENGPGVVRPLVEAASDMLQKTSQQDEMETAYVISTDCISCGSCADICPIDAISADDLQYNIDVGMCVECGACADVCPVNAIFVWKL